MAWKFRAFIWGGVLVMGVLSNNIGAVGTAWAQMPPQDVVVLPKQQRPTVRSIGDVFRDCPECPEMVILPPGMTTTTVRRPMAVFGKKGIVPFALRAEARGTIIIHGIFVLHHGKKTGRVGGETTLAFGLRGQWLWHQIPTADSTLPANRVNSR